MKKTILALSLGLMFSLNAAANNNRKVVYYDYNPANIYTLTGSGGLVSTIEFPTDEIVLDYVVGFNDAWDPVQPENTNILHLSPTQPDAQTNLVVVTKDKDNKTYTYLFNLLSSNDTWTHPDKAQYTFAIKFRDHESEEEKEKARKEREQASQNISDKPIETGYMFTDYDYRTSELADIIVPYRVWDNGLTTFIQFKDGAYRPSIYSYDTEIEKLLNFTSEKDGTVILHGVYKNILIRLDKHVVELRRNTDFKLENRRKTTTRQIRALKDDINDSN